MSTYPLTANKVYGSEIYFTKTICAPPFIVYRVPLQNYFWETSSDLLYKHVVSCEYYSIYGGYISITNDIQYINPVREFWESSETNYYRTLLNTGHGGSGNQPCIVVSIRSLTKYQRSVQGIQKTSTTYREYTTFEGGSYYKVASQLYSYTFTGSISIDKDGYDSISKYGDDVTRSLRHTNYSTTDRCYIYSSHSYSQIPNSTHEHADAYAEVKNFIIDAYVYRSLFAGNAGTTVIKNGTFVTSDPIIQHTLPYYSATGAFGSVFYGNGGNYYMAPALNRSSRNSITYANNVVEIGNSVTTGTQTSTYNILYG